MNASLDRSRPLSTLCVLALPCVLALGTSCGGGGGSGAGQAGTPGAEVTKPGSTETFFVDVNQSGQASRIFLEQISWGRLVDVHDVDAFGVTNPDPIFRDMVINELIQTDASNYLLESNPITQKERLIVRRTRGAANAGNGTFIDLVRQASESLSPDRDRTGIGTPLIEDPTGGSELPGAQRHASSCASTIFSTTASTPRTSCPITVRVAVGYPPDTPFSARQFFDPNHGGVVNGEFHSSRILIDMTVSELESALSGADINGLGLPVQPSGARTQPNLSRCAFRRAWTSGTGPVHDPDEPGSDSGHGHRWRDQRAGWTTNARIDVVRGIRSGRAADQNNGFLAGPGGAGGPGQLAGHGDPGGQRSDRHARASTSS